MSKEPKPPEVKDEPGADERFAKGIANALRTPHKPHGPTAAPELKPVKRGRPKQS